MSLQQKNLYGYDLPKAVRNANYQMHQGSFHNKRQMVLTAIIAHPEGITDHEISKITGLSLSCVNGRRNELKELVGPVGIATLNDNGSNTVRTMWGII